MVVHLARASVIAQRFRLSVFYAHKNIGGCHLVQFVLLFGDMQTTTLRTAQRSFTLKDWASEKRNKFSQWFNGESATFSRLCGERFTHKEVCYAHLFLVVLLAACFVAEWLEGGAL